MPAADRRVLGAPEWRARLADDFREALRHGPGAAVQELRLARGPLGADLAELTVETVLLHGKEDVNAPVGIARWLTAQVPSVRLVETAGAAHLFTLERPDLIFAWVDGR